MRRSRAPSSDRSPAGPVRAAVRLVRAVSLLLPRRLRRRYGRDIVEAFEDEALDAWRDSGWAELTRQLLLAVADLLRESLRSRVKRRHNAVAALRRSFPGRSQHRAGLLDPLAADVRFAIRTLWASPGWSLAVIGTLALGIGVNTAIFALVDDIVFRPLPFADSERVVTLCETNERVGEYCVVSAANLRDWGARAQSLASVGAARPWTFSFVDESGSGRLRGAIATPGYIEAHGLVPVLGRSLTDADLEPGAYPVVLLTHGYWQRQFGGNRDVIGDTLRLDGKSFAVIGVLPPAAWIHGFDSAEVWAPLTATPEDTGVREWRGFVAVGRLADDATLGAVREELAAVRAGLEQEYPAENAGWGLRVVPLRDHIAAPARPLLAPFAGAVALVLLVACVNVASLMLVRADERAPEIAVRAALGAGRSRIARQLLTESLTLALTGGVVGFLLAAVLTRAFVLAAPPDIPRLSEVALDPRALAFCLLLAAGTAVVFGVGPARRAASVELTSSLRAARPGVAAAGSSRTLVVAQLAIASTLLFGAGLMTRAFTGLLNWEPGFDTSGIVIVWALADPSRLDDGQQIVAEFERGSAAIASIPGVTAVGRASAGPLFGGIETAHFIIAGRPDEPPDARPSVRWFDVGAGYFEAIGIELARGRGLLVSDDAASPPVAVINQAMASRTWPDGEPIGARIRVYDRDMEIVGVVTDVRPLRPDAHAGPEIYWPQDQSPRAATYFVIRSSLALAALDEQVRARLAQATPALELTRFMGFEERAAAEIVAPRFNLLVAALFAAVTVALAAVGTYGMIATMVVRRTHEVGIRLALGARPHRLVGGIVASGLRLVAAGLLLGMAGAVSLGRAISHLLYGVPVTDPLALLGVAALFTAVSTLACLVPARRASRVDPARALRAP